MARGRNLGVRKSADVGEMKNGERNVSRRFHTEATYKGRCREMIMSPRAGQRLEKAPHRIRMLGNAGKFSSKAQTRD